MKANAVVCHKHCAPEDLVFEPIDVPEPGKGQVLVQVKAAGLNYPEVLIIQGKYQFQPPHPFVPGGEAAGIVKKVGPGVKGLSEGDHVAVMTGWGAFAEMVVLEEFRCVKISKDVDFATASGTLMTYGTTIHAFRQRANLQKGETVLVLGAAGGVGTAAVDIAKAMGATVIAAASTDEKLELCKQLGADHVINYSKENLRERLKEITNNDGVDVVYDPVGDKYAEPAIRSLAWRGRYLVIGFAAGDIPKIPLNLALLKGSAIVGVFWGAFTSREPELHQENTNILLDLIAKGVLKPQVTQTYPLASAGQAIRDMMNRKVKGKAVLLVGDAAKI
ncbi:Quinone oxidoreductase-like protein 2 homolog [Durusdinium trenchii]|uniref:Quinone oxidoreductase-like protein 2 homolog n=1 Tax=Durusdinium trenchii TaxID=1381693 RepID=A0ABP0IKE3_9DINO